jgi:hypothetical protein
MPGCQVSWCNPLKNEKPFHLPVDYCLTGLPWKKRPGGRSYHRGSYWTGASLDQEASLWKCGFPGLAIPIAVFGFLIFI